MTDNSHRSADSLTEMAFFGLFCIGTSREASRVHKQNYEFVRCLWLHITRDWRKTVRHRSLVTVFTHQFVFTPKPPLSSVGPALKKYAKTNFGLKIMQVDSSSA